MIITVEDGVINGGMGSALAEFAADHQYKSRLIRLGIPDSFIHHGKPEELYADCGFDARSIEILIRKLWNS